MNISFDKKIIFFLLVCFLIYLQGIFELPVMDRDEARFATASKTMLINKDFIDIKMIDEVRYKKPIGIYWSQALMNSIFGDYPYDKIWIFRLPSILGFFICMIVVYFSIRKMENKEVAFLSIFFLILSLLTISEIHQSKTDGLLFLFISLCNLIIFRLILYKIINKTDIIAFWIFLAFGVLIKGPIIFIFTLFPILIFSFYKRKNILRNIFSYPGFIAFIGISLPWFILINIKSGGLFWHESVGHDLLSKVKSGQESHGFPPGYYTLLLFIFFWPGSIFLLNLIKEIKLNFRIIEKDNFSLYLVISFIIPLIFFELIPTKLPHYIYPSYLPLSILLSKFILKNDFSKRLLDLSLIPLLIFPFLIMFIIIFAILEYSIPDISLFVVLVLLLLFTILLTFFNIKKDVKTLLVFTSLFQFCTYFSLIYFLIPRLYELWISEKINNIISKYGNNANEIYTLGFNEPSLLFLTSHKAKNKIGDFNTKTNDKKILFVITEEMYKNLNNQNYLDNYYLLEKFTGFNYSKGKKINFRVYKN